MIILWKWADLIYKSIHQTRILVVRLGSGPSQASRSSKWWDHISSWTRIGSFFLFGIECGWLSPFSLVHQVHPFGSTHPSLDEASSFHNQIRSSSWSLRIRRSVGCTNRRWLSLYKRRRPDEKMTNNHRRLIGLDRKKGESRGCFWTVVDNSSQSFSLWSLVCKSWMLQLETGTTVCFGRIIYRVLQKPHEQKTWRYRRPFSQQECLAIWLKTTTVEAISITIIYTSTCKECNLSHWPKWQGQKNISKSSLDIESVRWSPSY